MGPVTVRTVARKETFYEDTLWATPPSVVYKRAIRSFSLCAFTICTVVYTAAAQASTLSNFVRYVGYMPRVTCE